MTTVGQVFEYTMSLIDERLESGVVDASTTTIFKKNTPFILTMLQDELIATGKYRKTHTITKALTSNDGNYQSYDMPDDFYEVDQIAEVETGGNLEGATGYKWLGDTLYIKDSFVGTISIVYYPIPDALTSETDELVLDDITCRTILTNGLASRLLTNENQKLSNFFNQVYEEMKNMPKRRRPATGHKIKDVYDSKMTY